MKIIQLTEAWVKDQLYDDATGHDWYHIKRVTQLAKKIGQREGADLFIVEMASLLHDLADDKLVEDERKAIEGIVQWLENLQVDQDKIDHIIEIIQTISFRGGRGERVRTLEAQVVQDADRLDAIGAIGIARAFQYSGAKGQPMYDPSLSKRIDMTQEEYRNDKSSAIHHFYEKLLLLKDKMNTKAGRKLAEERHEFMEQFLKQFYKEWTNDIR